MVEMSSSGTPRNDRRRHRFGRLAVPKFDFAEALPVSRLHFVFNTQELLLPIKLTQRYAELPNLLGRQVWVQTRDCFLSSRWNE